MNGPNNPIGWCDYTWNPVTGCKNTCPYCYARRIRQRFYPEMPWSEIIRFDERLEEPLKLKKPARIFVGSMTDLFARWMPIDNIKDIIEVIKQCPQHTFLFLTKNPYGYRRIKKFPKNCWLGVTVTSRKEWGKAVKLVRVKRDNIKFISIEPILDRIDTCYFSLCNWVILGGLTPHPVHKAKWINDFLELNRKLKLPIFMKDNLKPIWRGKLKQEFPDGRNQIQR